MIRPFSDFANSDFIVSLDRAGSVWELRLTSRKDGRDLQAHAVFCEWRTREGNE